MAEAGIEVLAAQQLHHEVGRSVLHAIVVNADDVRRLEVGRGARLALETRDQGGSRGEVRVQELDGDGRAELDVAGDPHSPHAAARKRLLHLVFAADNDSRNDLHTGLPRSDRGRYARGGAA